MNQRITALEKSLALLANDVREIKTSLSKGFTIIDNNFKTIQKSFNNLEAEVLTMNAKIDNLQGNTSKSLKIVDGRISKSLKDVDRKLSDLQKEIKIINKVSGFDKMADNLKVVGKKGS